MKNLLSANGNSVTYRIVEQFSTGMKGRLPPFSGRQHGGDQGHGRNRPGDRIARALDWQEFEGSLAAINVAGFSQVQNNDRSIRNGIEHPLSM